MAKAVAKAMPTAMANGDAEQHLERLVMTRISN
jgi:hypothetical protein